MTHPPSGPHTEIPSPATHPAHVLASQKITERFFRNPAKPADEDVEERSFLISEERIQLRYHCREDHITASRREFLRRTEVDSKGNKIIMTPDMCVSYEVGLGATAGRVGGSVRRRKQRPCDRSQQLGGPGVETPGSQPGSSCLPLGKMKSSPPRVLLFAALLKLLPFPPRKTTQQAKTTP